MKRLLFILFFLTPLIFIAPSCSDDNNGNGDDKEEPVPDPEPFPEPEIKDKMLWFDAEANFERFATKENITKYLTKAKETGFNKIVVDVRSVQGDVLYKSDFMPELTDSDGIHIERDWDYLQYFLDEAKRLELKVTVSTTVFVGGKPRNRSGMVYRDNSWDGKTCMQYTKNGMLDIKDDPGKVAAFLNPILPEVQDFCMKYIKEIVTKYDFDGYALDYCRYPGDESDFSQASKVAFEAYTGQIIENFPEDIYTWNADGTKKQGKYYKEWWEFRAMTIHNFVKRVKEEIKKIKPDIELEYWAASWYGALYVQGQNWGAKEYDTSTYYFWASANYKNAGFAEHLDTFLCGTYLKNIFGMDDPESIEYGLANAKNVIQGKCKMYGTLYAGVAQATNSEISDAVNLCLTKTEGLMVFDIVQVIEYDLWDGIKDGINRSE